MSPADPVHHRVGGAFCDAPLGVPMRRGGSQPSRHPCEISVAGVSHGATRRKLGVPSVVDDVTAGDQETDP
ncbi:hypothetical protein GCM10009772_48980 [Pseudonocardia alni subsp. carboxydivorans]